MLTSRPLAFFTFPLLLVAACNSAPELSDTQRTACVVREDGRWGETADGTVDVERRSLFRDDGLVWRIENHTTYYPNDEAEPVPFVDGYTDFFYDHAARTIREEEWSVGDESPRAVKTFAYDEEGRISKIEFSPNAFGNTGFTEHEYGEFGLDMTLEVDGERSTRTEYTYDDAGLRTRIDISIDDLRSGESRTISSHVTYDDSARVAETTTRHEWGQNDARNFQLRTTYRYNERGDLIEEELDSGDDGTLDSVTLYLRDDDGNLLSRQIDCDLDGIVDWRDDYGYDASGRLVFSSRQQQEHDTVVFLEKTYDYGCHE